MNALQEFKFNESAVRVVSIDNEPYWCATDVCKILGYSSGRQTVKDICKSKGVSQIDTLTNGGVQSLTYIDESNLYRLIMRSKLPNAEKFQDWVHDEVLPQIRKAGSYSLPTDPHDQVLMLCEKLSAMAIEAKQLTKEIAEKEMKLIKQAPKVALADQFISDSDFCLSMVDIAQSIYINGKPLGRNRLVALMKADGIIYEDQSKKNHVGQDYIKYFKSVPGKSNGHSFNAIKANAEGSLLLIGKYNNK